MKRHSDDVVYVKDAGVFATFYPPESLIHISDRYFIYSNERQMPGIAIADKETILYGSTDRIHKSGYLVEANTVVKRILYVKHIDETGKETFIRVDQDSPVILDLNDAGERWEGPILDGEPFGWGLFYDENGCLVYEGFSIFGKYCLFGTEYYPDIHKIRYRGCWCEGVRCGVGVLYDRNGVEVYTGEWIEDSQEIQRIVVVKSSPLLPSIHSMIDCLYIGEGCCNDNTSLRLEDFPLLQEVIVRSNSFSRSDGENMVFSCINCQQLRKIILGDRVMKGFTEMIIQGGEWRQE